MQDPPTPTQKIVGLKLCWVVCSFVRWGCIENFRLEFVSVWCGVGVNSDIIVSNPTSGWGYVELLLGWGFDNFDDFNFNYFNFVDFNFYDLITSILMTWWPQIWWLDDFNFDAFNFEDFDFDDFDYDEINCDEINFDLINFDKINFDEVKLMKLILK